MRSVKGEITVFLSLSFTLLLSFIFGILESAVIQGSKNLSRIDTDRAIYSVFGEYHQELMEQYHVLGIDLGYRTGNYEEENITVSDSAAHMLEHYDDVRLYGRNI